MDLLETVRLVADLRRTLTEKKRALSDARATWELEHKWQIEEANAWAGTLVGAENELRMAAVREFRQSGSKSPAPGVGIRVGTRLEYASDAAVAWAIEHGHQELLQINAKAFERAAPNFKLDWVTAIEEPTATLATDLDKALRESDAIQEALKGEDNG